MPEETCLVGYANDIAALVAGHMVLSEKFKTDLAY